MNRNIKNVATNSSTKNINALNKESIKHIAISAKMYIGIKTTAENMRRS